MSSNNKPKCSVRACKDNVDGICQKPERPLKYGCALTWFFSGVLPKSNKDNDTRVMESDTSHTVTIDARLSSQEWWRGSSVAMCKVWLKSKKRCSPWFLPIFRKTVAIGEGEIILTCDKKPYVIKVKLPKVRRETEFDVFFSMFGRQHIAIESVIITPTRFVQEAKQRSEAER